MHNITYFQLAMQNVPCIFVPLLRAQPINGPSVLHVYVHKKHFHNFNCFSRAFLLQLVQATFVQIFAPIRSHKSFHSLVTASSDVHPVLVNHSPPSTSPNPPHFFLVHFTSTCFLSRYNHIPSSPLP